ncbi:MAG: NAD(P)-dependent glycerol-3-phosphate dehydrogenase [Bordetella sp.]|nr:MAG: NAD(P)-dependent glycerol-3-phosphate dehydrogenase [Bordetella sp.]
MHVVILGAGSWGTALAIEFSRLKHYTYLWARDSMQVNSMNQNRENIRYLPNISLPSNLKITNDLNLALSTITFNKKNSLIILGVPTSGLSNIFHEITSHISIQRLSNANIIWTCKGFEKESSLLPFEISRKFFSKIDINTGVLSGPSFAKEVAKGLPVALTVASDNIELCSVVAHAIRGKCIRPYITQDMIGVEIGGALKNIIAIACGISDGLNLGSNARAAIITRGLAEMRRFGIALGAKSETFSGLTGLGDLTLTATGDLSRNRKIGIEIGNGKKLSEILSSGITVEGVYSIRSALKRSKELGIELPIIEVVYSILFENLDPISAVSVLLSRSGPLYE